MPYYFLRINIANKIIANDSIRQAKLNIRFHIY